MDINFERLPDDVMHIMNIDYDDDDDPDKGGQGILGKKSKSNMKKEEEEKIPLPYSGKPKDDDNDDDEDEKGKNIARKTSDEYRSELALLENEKEKLMKEKNIKVRFQSLKKETLN